MNEQVTMQIFDGMLTRPKRHWIGPFDWWGLSRPDIVMKRIVQTSGVEQKIHLVKIWQSPELEKKSSCRRFFFYGSYDSQRSVTVM